MSSYNFADPAWYSVGYFYPVQPVDITSAGGAGVGTSSGPRDEPQEKLIHKPKAVRPGLPPVLDFQLRKARDAAHHLFMSTDGTVRGVSYTGRVIPIPISFSEERDMSWEWRVFNLKTNREGVDLHSVSWEKGDVSEMVSKYIMGADKVFVDEVNRKGLFIRRGYLPSEIYEPPERAVISWEKCVSRQTTRREVLTKILLKQKKWYSRLSNAETTAWHANDHIVWQLWAQNPVPQCIWITAILRTLPDGEGKVYYFPELEFHEVEYPAQ